ncbi:polyribonucleotide nucleotidyltransferase, partial [bacterium]|nr:polyribonucleotide nucleotidyltransferase [bacterium]
MKFKLQFNGKEMTADMSGLTERANGSCLLRYGETVVLATVVMSQKEAQNQGFLPLSVEYLERYYAAGKILGSRFIRRESRPTNEAIITARLIDRAIRPRFPKNLNHEVQVIVTCLSWDRENDPDVLGLIATSLALGTSDIPWNGPLGALRIAKLGENFIVNPTYEQREKPEIDLCISSIKSEEDGLLINMLEGEAQEVDEEILCQTVRFAKPYLEKLIRFQEEIIEKIGKKKIKLVQKPRDQELENEIKGFLKERLSSLIFTKEGDEQIKKIREEMYLFVEQRRPSMELEKRNEVEEIFEKEVKQTIEENILKNERRPDGRGLDEIRNISCRAGILPRTHGSALFRRGKTRSLSILTLGGPDDMKLLEGMEIIGKKRFMHHYNFPPYSVGEVKPLRAPSRREIGHGMLAERALLPIIPDFENFPYTIRIVTEILSSNGSTSMASVCSSSLALMDAGVPIKRPVAGISLGLIKDENNFKILTDIQGPEDHYGGMDFKVAGTKQGITAIQMDVKIDGINEEILRKALTQGKKARLEILERMEEVLDKPRPKLSPFAPKIFSFQINPEKIGLVIGSEGKTINQISRECEVSI